MNDIKFSKEVLTKMWEEVNWQKAEKYIFDLQQELTKASILKKNKKVEFLSNKIVNSLDAKLLAVRKVSEQLNSTPGIDNERWITSAEKMMAVFRLNSKDYKAKPFRRFIIKENGRERRVNIPSMIDRAMQILHIMALDPISEVTADRKSFAFRKGRSTFDVHSLIMHVLEERDGPQWFLICDVKSFYDSISHKWLLDNIPMDKYVLKEFLEAGVVFNGELFPTDEGISLGNNISTILGNMTLDGLQKELYDIQDQNNIDYYDGYAIRFADDILVTARTRESATKYLEIIKRFVEERGLILSEKKTHLVHISEGFNFLSRFYYKNNGIAHSMPSDKAIINLENSLQELILNNKKISQKRLIQKINEKIVGWGTYQRVTEARETFKHIDNVVLTLLISLLRRMYPNKTIKQLVDKYWYKDIYGRPIFCLPTNKDVRIVLLADLNLVRHKRLDFKKNVYLDLDYFQDRAKLLEMQKISGKYKTVWIRQDGLCFNCGLPIQIDQPRTIILKNPSLSKNSIKNMAYVHTFCSEDELFYFDNEEININKLSIKKIISEFDEPILVHDIHKKSVYKKLNDYFAKCDKVTFQLTFKEIEKILEKKLCDSLYKYKSYWYIKNKYSISSCWLNNGFVMRRLNIKEKKVTFTRSEDYKSKLNIPTQILKNNMPKSAKYELEQFYDYIIKKYKL